MKSCLLLVLLIAACSHGFSEGPVPIDCPIDTLTAKFDTIAALTGSFSARLVPQHGPKEIEPRTVWLDMDPKTGHGWPLGGLAGIIPTPFSGVELFTAPDNREEVIVWFATKTPGMPSINVGSRDEGPVVNLVPAVIGKNGFAGTCLMIWWVNGKGKEKRAFGGFCALRTA